MELWLARCFSSCPYAHRNAGDTERRYHPRYFKTGNCIYDTTETGACVKNGLHCAFAHGPEDLRPPVYDIREVQDASSSKVTVNLPASLEKERVLSEDPTWNGALRSCSYFAISIWPLSCLFLRRIVMTSYDCICLQNEISYAMITTIHIDQYRHKINQSFDILEVYFYQLPNKSYFGVHCPIYSRKGFQLTVGRCCREWRVMMYLMNRSGILVEPKMSGVPSYLTVLLTGC